eukprot:TRINITY_DN104_c0_g1_i2.p1 TRINITY_DN104_c0_g1~~TRINITY_DN104_c0_g1_i2.p1  ORF type:complete len:381 (+),score=132.11 TRINITY_DN104_c0_g1_i2:54-1196(+)
MLWRSIAVALAFVAATVSAHAPRWGILGPGRIASDFAGSLTIAGANVTAVAAGTLPNTLARAQAFAQTWNIPTAYGSYDELGQDPNVDIVYIATVNFLHYDNAKLMLNYGKNVLLEKPATMDAGQLAELQQLAKSKDLFFHVNFWTRQFPAVKWMRQLVADGALGDLLQISADVSFSRVEDRLVNKTMGGGSLMDVGCYELQYGTMFNGGKFPDQFSAIARLNEQGVDNDISMTLSWGKGAAQHLSTFTAGIDKNGLSAIMFIGTKGRFEIRDHFNNPDTVYFFENKDNGDGDVQSVLSFTFNQTLPAFPVNAAPIYPQAAGFTYTVEAVNIALQNGEKFLKEIAPEEQLTVMQLADSIRHQVGVFWDYETKTQNKKIHY